MAPWLEVLQGRLTPGGHVTGSSKENGESVEMDNVTHKGERDVPGPPERQSEAKPTQEEGGQILNEIGYI